jgi:hypothetical protein
MSINEIPKTTPREAEEEIHALLEKCLIEEYLKSKGHTQEGLRTLPEGEAQRLRKEASIFASSKLAEIEIRARFTRDLHSASSSLER